MQEDKNGHPEEEPQREPEQPKQEVSETGDISEKETEITPIVPPSFPPLPISPGGPPPPYMPPTNRGAGGPPPPHMPLTNQGVGGPPPGRPKAWHYFLGLGLGLIPALAFMFGYFSSLGNLSGIVLAISCLGFPIAFVTMIVLLSIKSTRMAGYGLLTAVLVSIVIIAIGCSARPVVI